MKIEWPEAEDFHERTQRTRSAQAALTAAFVFQRSRQMDDAQLIEKMARAMFDAMNDPMQSEVSTWPRLWARQANDYKTMATAALTVIREAGLLKEEDQNADLTFSLR